jgi:transposase
VECSPGTTPNQAENPRPFLNADPLPIAAIVAVINQMRGLLLERGITIRKGRRHIEESLSGILEDADNKLSGALRVLLTQLRVGMQYLQRQVDECDKLILRIADELEDCRRIQGWRT